MFKRLATVVTASVALALALTGCSGGSTASGTYVAEHEGLMVVDGDTVTWGEHSCDDVSKIDAGDDYTSVGTLDKTRTTIAWIQEGRWSKTDPFTESEDGSVITVGDKSWTKIGTEAADAVLADKEKSCAEYKETLAKREEANAERVAKDARITAKYKASATKVIDGFLLLSEDELGEDLFETPALQQLLKQNGITEEEFTSYLDADPAVIENYLHDHRFHMLALCSALSEDSCDN